MANVANNRVDWYQRDNEILSQIKGVVDKILNSDDKPERITISLIGNKLSIRGITVVEGCNCDYCKNYIKNCGNFSQEVLNFYNMLGIDPQKEGEFMEYYKPATNEHLYMGFYHLVGEIVKKPRAGIGKWDESNIIKVDNVKFTFTDELDLVPKNFPKPVIQLEFEVMLPWLLGKKPF